MKNQLLGLRDELIDGFYAKKIYGSSERAMGSIAELGMVDVGILTQAAAILLEREGRPAEPDELYSIAAPVARHVGSTTDMESNRLMSQIGGKLFKDCFDVLRNMSGGNSYFYHFPRMATPEDVTKAQKIDPVIATHAADFISSEEGQYLLQPVEAGEGGCPLRRMRTGTSPNNYFDLLVKKTAIEYADPASPFAGIGYYGIAQSIAVRLLPDESYEGSLHQRDPEAFYRQQEEMGGCERDWQLPDPDVG